MKYVIKNIDGEEVHSGNSCRLIPDTVPTHGSISIQVEGKDGIWLNIKTSEWLTLTYSLEPQGWEYT